MHVLHNLKRGLQLLSQPRRVAQLLIDVSFNSAQAAGSPCLFIDGAVLMPRFQSQLCRHPPDLRLYAKLVTALLNDVFANFLRLFRSQQIDLVQDNNDGLSIILQDAQVFDVLRTHRLCCQHHQQNSVAAVQKTPSLFLMSLKHGFQPRRIDKAHFLQQGRREEYGVDFTRPHPLRLFAVAQHRDPIRGRNGTNRQQIGFAQQRIDNARLARIERTHQHHQKRAVRMEQCVTHLRHPFFRQPVNLGQNVQQLRDQFVLTAA